MKNKNAAPFVTWVGGKRKLLKKLLSLMPKNFGDYYEPFLGGGALFYNVHDFNRNFYLSDNFSDLIITYQQVKNNLEALVDKLEEYKRKHNKEYFFEIRDNYHTTTDPIYVAANLIYMSKKSFRGIMRFNLNGRLSCSVNDREVRLIYDYENIKKCSECLSNAEISCNDYKVIQPKRDDFVYFDPPYHGMKDSYYKYHFDDNDQRELAEFAIKLTKQGVKVMLTNYSTPFINELYSSKYFNLNKFSVSNHLSYKGNTFRDELIITNYTD